MIFFALSAAVIGALHSILSPGHWLPVALLGKAHHWSKKTSVLAALVAASGHILVSVAIALVGIAVGARFLSGDGHAFERVASWGLILFGSAYAAISFFRHSGCVGHAHDHHGPDFQESNKGPFLFLFSLGIAPCIAVFPVFGAAAAYGVSSVIVTFVGFAMGVVVALVSATLLASMGVQKLHHPWIEHYGDVVTGLTVVLMGILLPFIPHQH